MGEAVEETLPDLALFSSTLAAITGSAESVANLLSSTELPEYSNGISLLSLKNNLLLSYMHNMTLLLLERLHGRSLVEGDSTTENGNTVRKALVERLIQERIMLEKIKPLEVRLRYQVDKLVKKAENADRLEAEGGNEAQTEEDIANDPLAFRPNPAALMNNGNASDSEDASDDDRAGDRGANVKASASGVYKPPRLAPVPYTGDERRGKKERKAPAGNALVRDMATTMANASNPYIESTSGLSITPSLQSRKASKLKDIERYEEENFTRLFMTKKDAKRRRLDEEDIALGGTGSREDLMAGSKGVRGQKSHGLENEFDDLLGSIGKKRKTGAADGYDALRALRREKRPAAGDNELVNTNGIISDAGRPGDKKKKSRGRFENAVSRAGHRSKNR